MTLSFIIFVIAASIAAVLTPFSRWVAVRLGAVDIPDRRKIHRAPMPRLGGVAILLAIIIPILGLMVVQGSHFGKNYGINLQLIVLLCGGVVIAFLGAVDDIKGVRAAIKFSLQVVLALVAWFVGFRFQNIGVPFLGPVHLPIWIDLPVTVLWITGIISAMNIVDGLDGLAAGIAFFVSATNFVMAYRSGNELGILFSSTIAGSVIGFLLFNWNPAIVFMGDIGSMFLGYILATTSIITNQKSSTAVAMVVPVIALGLPVMDTLLSIVRRFIERRPIFSPDKGHLHHRLLKAGFTQQKAVLTLYAISLIFAVSAVALTALQDIETGVIFVVLAVATITIMRFTGLFQPKKILRAFGRNRIAEHLREGIEKFSVEVIEGANSIDDVWNKFVDFCRSAGFYELEWRTAGIKPSDARNIILINTNSEDYKKIAGKGIQSVRTTVTFDAPAFFDIKLRFPQSLGKLDHELNAMVQLIGEMIGSSLLQLRERGLWVATTTANTVNANVESSILHENEDTSKKIQSDRESILTKEHRLETSVECNDPDHFDLIQNNSSSEGCVKSLHNDSFEANPIFDDAWKRFVDMCRERGFYGVGWKTYGVKVPDYRKIIFNDSDTQRKVIKWSVSLSTLAFVELWFSYPGKNKKKFSRQLKKATKSIATEITKKFVGIYREDDEMLHEKP